MHFTDYPTAGFSFDSCLEKDFFIRYVGFHNFDYIKPIKTFRIQRFFTLHIILHGSGVVKVGDREYKASKGDMFFIPPEVNLCYYPNEDDKWKYVWFELKGEFSGLYAEKMGFSAETHVKRCRSFEKTVFLLERIFTDRMNNKPIGYYDVLSVFFKILDENVRKTENQSTIDGVVDYINCHFPRHDLSVPEICDKFNISHSYLCRIFKNTMGGTVKNYITKVRVNEACRLLEATNSGIKEVADSVGFSDDIHFMKVFKNVTKKTPTEYRKSSMYSLG